MNLIAFKKKKKKKEKKKHYSIHLCMCKKTLVDSNINSVTFEKKKKKEILFNVFLFESSYLQISLMLASKLREKVFFHAAKILE